MKRVLSILLVFMSLNVFSQIDSLVWDSGVRFKKRTNQVFWGAEEGWFFGVANRFDMGTYSVGLEFKGYLSFYGLILLNGSVYGGYNYLFDFENRTQKLSHNIRAGFHFSLIGAETNVYFGKFDEFTWTLMPKVGLEWGHLSLFYGYHLPIINTTDMSWKNFHSFTLIYSLRIAD